MLNLLSHLFDNIESSNKIYFRLFRIITLVLIFTVFSYLKFNHRTSLSLDSDEIFSVNYSKHYDYNPLNFQNPFDDGNPPGHYILIKIWTNLFGFSDSAVRLLPVTISVVAYVYFYLISIRLLKLTFFQVVLASLLFQGSSLLFSYSINIRPYFLLVLTSLATYYHLGRFSENEKQKIHLVVGNLWSVIGLFNHYSFVIFLLFYLITELVIKRKKALKKLLFLLPAFVAFSPWAIRFLLSQFFPEKYGLGVSYYFWQADGLPLDYLNWFSLLMNNFQIEFIDKVLLLGISVILLTQAFNLLRNKKVTGQQVQLLIFMLVSLGLFFFTPLHTILTLPRYSIFLAPFFFLALPLFAPQKYQNIILLLLIILAISISQKYFDYHFALEDWRSVAQYLEEKLSVNNKTLVLTDQYYFMPALAYYLKNESKIGCLAERDISETCRYSINDLNQFDKIFYLQYEWNSKYDGFLEDENWRQIDYKYFPAIELYEFSNQK